MKIGLNGMALMLLAVVTLAGCGGGKTGAASSVDNIAYTGSFPASTVLGMTRATLIINGIQRDLPIYRSSATQSLPLMIFFDGTGTDLPALLKADYSWMRTEDWF